MPRGRRKYTASQLSSVILESWKEMGSVEGPETGRREMHPPGLQWQRSAFRPKRAFSEKERASFLSSLLEKKRKMQMQEIFSCLG